MGLVLEQLDPKSLRPILWVIWRLESWPQEVIETQRQFQSSDRKGQIWRPALPHQSQLNGRFNTDFMYQLEEFFNLELLYYRGYREQRKTAGELQLGCEKGCHIHKRKRENGRRRVRALVMVNNLKPLQHITFTKTRDQSTALRHYRRI